MSDPIEKSIATLNDADAGWVNRRDAADHLAKTIRTALSALHAHKEDPDQDVRSAVAGSLNALGLDVPLPVSDATSLGKLVRALERKGSRDVAQTKEGFEVVVQTKEGRSQKVSIVKTTSNTKREIIRVSTTCAPADESAYAWCLKNNLNMSHCSLATEEIDGKTWLVLVNNHLAEAISFEELKLTVKEVAFYGDWVEEKLAGGDVH